MHKKRTIRKIRIVQYENKNEDWILISKTRNKKGRKTDIGNFHDLYVKKKGGGYSQIDLVVATPQGLVVIEVKDYSGWLFGNDRQRYWTQILNYGQEKYRFYNPIMQNAGHIRALKEQSE